MWKGKLTRLGEIILKARNGKIYCWFSAVCARDSSNLAKRSSLCYRVNKHHLFFSRHGPKSTYFKINQSKKHLCCVKHFRILCDANIFNGNVLIMPNLAIIMSFRESRFPVISFFFWVEPRGIGLFWCYCLKQP